MSSRPKRTLVDSCELVGSVAETPVRVRVRCAALERSASNEGGLVASTRRLRAICEHAPSTLPEINLDLSADEESELGARAFAALQRLKALWGAQSA